MRVYKKSIVLNPQTEIITENKRTIVAYGDITLTADLIAPDGTAPLAIVALKDELGNGGNIYITSPVKRLDASIIAQGTIFSGDNSSGIPHYYALDNDAITTLNKQLYIYGTISSLNTIG